VGFGVAASTLTASTMAGSSAGAATGGEYATATCDGFGTGAEVATRIASGADDSACAAAGSGVMGAAGLVAAGVWVVSATVCLAPGSAEHPARIREVTSQAVREESEESRCSIPSG